MEPWQNDLDTLAAMKQGLEAKLFQVQPLMMAAAPCNAPWCVSKDSTMHCSGMCGLCQGSV